MNKNLNIKNIKPDYIKQIKEDQNIKKIDNYKKKINLSHNSKINEKNSSNQNIVDKKVHRKSYQDYSIQNQI